MVRYGCKPWYGELKNGDSFLNHRDIVAYYALISAKRKESSGVEGLGRMVSLDSCLLLFSFNKR